MAITEPVKEIDLDPSKWTVSAWNYRWSKQYGSLHFNGSEPDVEGTEAFKIAKIDRTNDGRKLIIHIPDLHSFHTLKLDLSVVGEDATELTGPVYFTIHG